MRLQFANITLSPNILQAGAIVLLLFVLLLVLAYMSRNFLSWSLGGFGIGLAIGFILAIVLEGFLLIGGKTVVTGLLSVKNAPQPVQKVLDDGHTRLLEVLSVPKACWPEANDAILQSE